MMYDGTYATELIFYASFEITIQTIHYSIKKKGEFRKSTYNGIVQLHACVLYQTIFHGHY